MDNDDIFFENDAIIDVDLDNVYIIDQGAITKVVARKYSSESAYNIGDYVIYRNELYKCVADIPTPEEFDLTKWTKLFVVDELKNIYSILPTKADKSTTYTKTETDNLLNEKADADSVYTKTEVNDALNLKADKSETYTKTEVDDALALKADSSSVYSKTDTDTLLNTKADKSTTYTKTEVDTALANKANSTDVYTKTETYSKTEVDTDIYKKTETYNKTEVDNKIANLPTPMIMKGTLGTGGTITELPTASSENEGFTYKVITDGTYAGQAAKTGDLFTSAKPVGSSDYIWLYIPSGDETFTDTWRGIKVNGAEKLGSSINTGSVDFKDGTNSTAVFDPSDSSIKFNVDGYTQAQIDTKLADKANASDVYAKSETYSQTEVDSKLLDKANTSDVYTKQETYTKTEVNTALSEKADTSTVTTALTLKADKADTYTKEEVDDKFDEIDPIGTASGNPCTFTTDLADALVSLTANIVCGGGYDADTQTAHPLVGHTELNLTRCGVNLWDEEYQIGYWDINTGNYSNSAGELCSKNFIRVTPNTNYYFYRGYSSNRGDILFYDINGNYLHQFRNGTGNASFTTSAECYYIRLNIGGDYGDVYNNDVSINYPATDMQYHAYDGQTFTVAFGQTVYGGVYDKSGRLTITHTLLTFNGSENWTTRQSGVGTLYELNITEAIKAEVESISNMYVWEMNLTSNNTFRILASGNVKVIAIHDDNRTDLATFKTFLSNNNLTICVELATPIVIDVPSISVFAENGVNNIVSDGGGDVEVEYLKGSMAKDIKTVISTTKFADLSDIPNPPTTDGNYRLIVTITDGKPAYSWEKIT